MKRKGFQKLAIPRSKRALTGLRTGFKVPQPMKSPVPIPTIPQSRPTTPMQRTPMPIMGV